MRRISKVGALLVVLLTALAASAAAQADRPGRDTGGVTPIQHVVVIFQENVSFDHYFATYPRAANPAGEPPFTADRDTPSVNGLNEPLNAPNRTGNASAYLDSLRNVLIILKGSATQRTSVS